MNPQQPGHPSNPPQPSHPGATQPLPPGYAPPPGYPPQGYPPQMPGYPQGYPMPQGYPPQMPGYPQGYPMPQGYPPQMPGYPPGYMPTMPMPAMMPPPAPAPATGTVPAAPKPASASIPVAMPAPAAVAPSKPAPAGAAPSTPMAIPTAVPTDDEGEAVLVEHHEGEVYHPPALTHIEVGPPPNAFVQMWRKVGASSLLVSILVHAGLGVLALFIVFSTGVMDKQVDFLPGGGTAQGAKASADLQHKVQQKKRNSINKTMPMKKLVSTSMNSAITLPEAPPDALDMPDVSAMMGGGALGASGGFGTGGAGGGFGKGMGLGGAAGFVTLPPSMRARCSTQERLEKLRQNGGSPECEAAVSASLEWLKGKQNPDGSWGRGNKCAMTGLALLCYLGRCETPESPFYGDNVMKGIMYLIEAGKKNPHGIFSDGWKGKANGGGGGAGTYEHGIATYALGEMYTLARLGSKSLPGMRESFEKGVKVIIENQTKVGAWAYGGPDQIVYNKAGGADLSVVGWQFQALKAAKNTGLKIDGLHSAIGKMTDYLESTQTKDGGFGGANRDAHYNQWSLSGVGILGLQTMAKGKTTPIKKGIKFLTEFLTAEPLDWNKNCNLYCWYYYTQTFFQAGGEDWKFYNQQFLPQILGAQQPDGAFKHGRPNWPAGDAADEIYRQCLCTLQLEVYYRYLKVGDREESSFFDK
ncbi:MAG: prenyltransferase/squalene oxidase repeat-containing protein [Prosthecobacter sp.]|uniref:prenyltransferase/squalene oxidase repeat-containing protein n=1 Tax=Prosthecobacter sp. TaxID=1965333 RepID=UPI0038FE0675